MTAAVELYELGGWDALEWHMNFQPDGMLETVNGYYGMIPAIGPGDRADICYSTWDEDSNDETTNCATVQDFISTKNADIYVIDRVMMPDWFMTGINQYLPKIEFHWTSIFLKTLGFVTEKTILSYIE